MSPDWQRAGPNKNPLLAIIIIEMAKQRGYGGAHLESDTNTALVYCGKNEWITLLVDVARGIYGDER